jgi:hypothetical protein
MRREQRQALDKQLSTQAYYAAESGVNAAVKALKTNPNLSNNDCSKTDDLLPGSNDLGSGLEYTCVLVDDEPNELVYSPTSLDKSTFVKLTVPFQGTVDISWQPVEDLYNDPIGYVEFADDHLLPQRPLGTIDDPYHWPDSRFERQVRGSGILRVSLIPAKSPITRNDLINKTQTLFLYPNYNETVNQVGVHNYSTGKQGKGVFVDGQCNKQSAGDHGPGRYPYDCNVRTTLPGGTYYMRLKSIYTPHSVNIRVIGQGGQVSQPGTQAVIDSTGKSNDVLRRIQVRVPLNSGYSYPEFGLQTTNMMCKLIVWGPWLRAGYPTGQPNYAADWCRDFDQQ